MKLPLSIKDDSALTIDEIEKKIMRFLPASLGFISYPMYEGPSRLPKMDYPVITRRMGEGKADSKRDGKTTYRNGQVLS